jgi:hypothetical protein
MTVFSLMVGILGLIATILGLIATMVGLGCAIYSSRQLTKSTKIGALRQIRTAINRLAAEKKRHPSDSLQYSVMDHTQEDLEDVFENIRATFGVPDKDAPR